MKAILMSGPAGTGKSTWAKNKQLSSTEEYRIISSDETRFELFNKYWLDPEDERKIIPTMMNKVRQAYIDNVNIIIDVAVCKNKSRRKWANRINQYYKDIDLVIINTSIETALAQNKQRDRQVPEDTIKQMFSFIEEPDELTKKLFTNIIEVNR